MLLTTRLLLLLPALPVLAVAAPGALGDGSYAFVCPTAAASAGCPRSHGERIPRWVEDAFHSITNAVILSYYADPLAVERHPLYMAFLSWSEGLRITDCLVAYGPPCVAEADVERALGELCPQLRSDLEVLQQHALVDAGAAGTVEKSHPCWSPQASLGSSRTRALPVLSQAFHQLEQSLDQTRLMEWQAEKTPFPLLTPLTPPSAPWLLYPSAFTPPNTCNLESFSDALDKFIPEDEVHRPWRDVGGFFAPYMAADALLRRLQRKGVSLSGFSVNLGAANGACGWGSLYDPVNCLLADRASNTSAILFEGAERNFQSLLSGFGFRRNVHLRLGYTTPSLAARDTLDVMPAGGVDLLKVDVDNCDSCFVDAMLRAGTRPKLIHVELTAPIPPPLKARVHFQHRPKRWRMCGSLGEFLRVAPGYRLLHVEYVNVVLVREDLLPLVAGPTRLSDEEKWRLGYFCHPMRTLSTWGEDMAYRKRGAEASALADRRLPLKRRRELALALQPAEAQAGRYVILEAE